MTDAEIRASFESPKIHPLPYGDGKEGPEPWGTGKLNLSPTQRKMARVLADIDWSYCDYEEERKGRGLLGLFRPGSDQLILYRGACVSKSLYKADTSALNIGHRFMLVSSHEVGHAIDLYGKPARSILGMTKKDRVDAERRATLLGTYLAECASRLIQVEQSGPCRYCVDADWHEWWAENEPSRQCAVAAYQSMELFLAANREAIASGDDAVETLGGAVGCFE